MTAISPNAASVRALIDELAGIADDGGSIVQEVTARVPSAFDMDRAYVALISPDGNRFAVTYASTSPRAELLGYTQALARLPSYVRRCLSSGGQGSIGDAATFPFTAQQRRMAWYDGVGATIITPIRNATGNVCGALIVDAYRGPRRWPPAYLAALVALADALGSRLSLARAGAHLTGGDEPAPDERMRRNLLANLARSLERGMDPVETSRDIAEALGDLPHVVRARYVPAAEAAGLATEALAAETLVARTVDGRLVTVLPLILQGERFGAIEVVLGGAKLSADDDQFLRTVAVFTASAYASMLRRKRPRNESLTDPISGLANFRAIHEVLVEGVAIAKTNARPLAIWMIEIDELDAVNRRHGYATGDDVVGFIGATLAAAVKGRGTAGRVSGSVFLGVFEGTSANEATTAARILLERIAGNIPLHLPPFTLSAGVAGYPGDAVDPDELIRYARIALYAAKTIEDGTRVVEARSGDATWERGARRALTEALAAQLAPTSLRVSD